MAADRIEMKLHGLGVGKGQHKGGARSAGRADRAEQIDALVALIGRLAPPHVPRLTHCRTMPFFWPIRASS